jgi:cyclic-di-GMP-binding protein
MPSFDIVSKTDIHEVDNAVAGVLREISQRFDFKGSKCTMTREGNALTIVADDETKLRQMQELLRGYMARRKLDAAALDFQKPEAASGNALRQTVAVRQGVDAELGKRIVKEIKDSKLKVQVAIQGDELRVSGKKIDDLQAAIACVRSMKLDLPLQFVNMRS